MTRGYDRVLGIQALATACQHDSEPTVALESASQLVPVRGIAHRLEQSALAHQSGKPLEITLLGTRLFTSPQAKDLAFSASAGRLSFALEQLASFRRTRLLESLSLLVQVMIVGCVLLFAGLYGWYCYEVIQTLSQITRQVDQI
jgi:hypothetical protein